MLLSSILSKAGISFVIENEREFLSLGLADYNNKDSVCTFAEKAEYAKKLSGNISMLIVNKDVADDLSEEEVPFGLCIVDKPRQTFFRVHNILTNDSKYLLTAFKTRIDESAIISNTAVIAENNVHIGKNVIIEEFCVIRENTTIGDNSIIRAGCKIGGEGFEFKKDGNEVFPVRHVGSVIIGKNTEIQYNSCVDKAIYPWDSTIIGDYVKVDNLVHIAHAVKIGSGSMIVANSSIGGRVSIGENSWIGLSASVRNGISVGNNARVNMGAVVTRNVSEGKSVSGNFAIDHESFIEKIKKNN